MEQAQPSSEDQPASAPPDNGPPSSRRSGLLFAGLALIGIVAVLALAFGGNGDNDPAISTDGAAEVGLDAFPFTNEDGTEGSLSEYTGQPTVVNFYASWCAPCRAELPHFRDVQAEAGDRVQFLGINHDLEEGSWRALNEEFELNYPTVFQQEQGIYIELDLLAMPSTAFMAPDGEIVHTFSGVLNDTALKELIAEHLGIEV